ncbi:hypothetical protein C8R45DRAFT_945546 [Mycena sanguinolenta]|nr:hypothetical protein C8R45DRAFT_945546 [Mycena sanguinolenta]
MPSPLDIFLLLSASVYLPRPMGRKRAKEPMNGRPSTSKAAEKVAQKREIAAKYRLRPEVREKQRLRMAEKRAAEKARRRQWDPPKVTMTRCRRTGFTKPEHLSNLLPPAPCVSASPPSLGDIRVASLTPAEHCALMALAGMSEEQVRDTILSRAESLSCDSSVVAVQREPMDKPFVTEPHWYPRRLPPYVTPETQQQKKMRREVGKVGPLTAVQLAQIYAYELGSYSRERAKHMKDLKVKHKTGPFLSSGRWERICSWRDSQLEYETDWDNDARQEITEVQWNTAE